MKSSPRFVLLEIMGAVIVGAGLFLLVVLFLQVSRPARTPVGLATAVLTVIPAPTSTPLPPTATPTPVLPTPVPAGAIGPGVYVQVVGTSGEGLRLRAGPGLDQEQLFVGLESEIFEVIGGPETGDGYTWWQLQSPHDQNRGGWAVGEYLDAVEEP